MSSAGKGAVGLALVIFIILILCLLGLSAFVWITGVVELLGVSFAGGVGLYLLVLIVAWAIGQVIKAAAEAL